MAKDRTKQAIEKGAAGVCELCGRTQLLTRHHLIPRAVHRKRRFQRQYEKEETQRRSLLICRLCHDGIHDLVPDEKHLAEQYNTRDGQVDRRRAGLPRREVR